MILKVAYTGIGFCGSQVQPKGRTVEGEINSALERLGLIDSDADSRFRILSRTDRGVSACGNLAVFEPKGNLSISRLNHELPEDIFVIGKSDGKIRYPLKKHYAYLILKDEVPKIDIDRLVHSTKLFSGKHDFSNFARIEKDKAKSPVRDIDVSVEDAGNIVIVHFYGTGFLWQMIRRIVKCMTDYSFGKLSENDVLDLIERRISKKYQAAKPENLILIDIDAGVRFEADNKIKKEINEKMGLLEKESFFFSQL
ncbi:MAG: tRNA pseudouridine(38-40) synthase TruA [Candidatus Aenigmarchaeota archaeon]|nr:tRNA pseudouridine(38-40) synthase TruA [Candidatus Aenigmarchaeota archaeon]